MPFLPIVEVIRIEENEQFGTFGILRIQKNAYCVTLEPPDRENETGRSSIPAQQYVCKPYTSQKYPNVFQIMDVPGRTKVLFHAGNVVDHTRGCIILAQHYGKLKGNRAILNSGKTFDGFRRILNNVESFHLTIYECY